jgi:hypothetical protein
MPENSAGAALPVRDAEWFATLADSDDAGRLATLGELIGRTGFDAVFARLVSLYPGESEFEADYRGFHAALAGLAPDASQDVCVTLDRFPVEDGVVSVDVVGFDLDGLKPVDLEWYGWDCWLAFRADRDEVEGVGADSFLAHCFYKMTLNGYTREDIRANLERKASEPEPGRELIGGPKSELFPGLDPDGLLSRKSGDRPRPPLTVRQIVVTGLILILAIAAYLLFTRPA